MKRTALKDLVAAVSDSALVGHLLCQGLPERAGSAADVIRLIEGCSQDRVAVEEQHHDSFIIHLSNQPIRWVSIPANSPLFLELRRLHAQWMAQHPGWNDWMWF